MARKAFNPVEYRNDFIKLASQEPGEAADVAMKWRERFMRKANEMSKTTERVAEVGIAGLSSFGVAYLDGGWEAKRDALIADWINEGASRVNADVTQHPTPFTHPEGVSDPTKLFNVIDRVLVITLLLAGAAAAGVGGDDYNGLLRAAAVGTGSYWAGSLGRSLAYRRAANRLAEQEVESVKRAAA